MPFENIDFSKKSILIVDDMIPTRELLRSLFQRAGFGYVSAAGDGIEAMDILNTIYFDIVLSDWIMPNMGGLRLLEHLRESEDFKDILFLMVTNNSDKEDVMQAVEHHVDGYVVKPFSPRILLHQVAEALTKQTRFRNNIKLNQTNPVE